jgi:putative DNA primase/helicase
MFDKLKDAMRQAGVDPANAPLTADGKLRRFRLPEDRPKSKNGYITLFDNGDGTHGASFGSWKYGIKETWFSGRPYKQLTAEEKREFAQKMAAAKARQEEEQRRLHAAAAQKARRLWDRAKPAASSHPYLTRKQVHPHGIKKLGSSLVVPVRNTAGQLTGLQFIDPDGGKTFLSGTAVAGCYHAIGQRPESVLLLAEGYATAATLFEATGHPCAVSFFAGNLKPVALALKGKYPQPQIVICADADPAGRKAAKEAAAAVNGAWLEPNFSESETTI